MLRAPNFVELVMVSTAKVQECLSVVQKFAVKIFDIVVDNLDSRAILVNDRLTNRITGSPKGVSFASRQVAFTFRCILDSGLLDRVWYN